jgi:hypothetical protein
MGRREEENVKKKTPREKKSTVEFDVVAAFLRDGKTILVLKEIQDGGRIVIRIRPHVAAEIIHVQKPRYFFGLFDDRDGMRMLLRSRLCGQYRMCVPVRITESVEREGEFVVGLESVGLAGNMRDAVDDRCLPRVRYLYIVFVLFWFYHLAVLDRKTVKKRYPCGHQHVGPGGRRVFVTHLHDEIPHLALDFGREREAFEKSTFLSAGASARASHLRGELFRAAVRRCTDVTQLVCQRPENLVRKTQCWCAADHWFLGTRLFFVGTKSGVPLHCHRAS